MDVDAPQNLHPLGGGLRLVAGVEGRVARAQQRADAGQALFFAAIGEESVVPDAREALRQHVRQKAADEHLLTVLRYVERNSVRAKSIPIRKAPRQLISQFAPR